jgi:hypothetical protein
MGFSAGAILRRNTWRIKAHVKTNFAAARVLSVWFVFLLLLGISGSNSPTLLAAQYVTVDDGKHDSPDKVHRERYQAVGAGSEYATVFDRHI